MIVTLILAALLVAVAVRYRQRVHALEAKLHAEAAARRIAVTCADRAETTARQHEATVVMLLAELDRTPAALEWHGVGAGRLS